jgi:hypothetical protein
MRALPTSGPLHPNRAVEQIDVHLRAEQTLVERRRLRFSTVK